jgi:hydroxymethylpyrimidine pyrophosphatase-like HAD family hydrolase
MGQANEEVKSAATYSTTSSEEEGFANAVERYILKNSQ